MEEETCHALTGVSVGMGTDPRLLADADFHG
jgi:hypothetical protein